MQEKQQIIFLLSVDTEEEFDWDGPFPESNFAVENLTKLDEFQTFCERNKYRPIYFVDYAAAESLPKYPDFFNEQRQANYEIGAHLHPWANPPYFGPATEETSHVVNLPIEQVEQKLDALMTLFDENLHCKPTSFRTGRWGISNEIMQILISRGFDLDSSVYPFYENQYFNCLGSPLKPYWPSLDNVLTPGEQSKIMEMPVTIGFNKTPFDKYYNIYELCQRPAMQFLRATALLWHTRLLRKIYFSPEAANAADMIDLADASIQQNNQCLHMYLHSSSFLDNTTGFLNVDNAFEHICQQINEVTTHLESKYEVTYMTPSEYKAYLIKHPQNLAK